ncbi:hypothetical protein AB1Y20_006233 [Prymnesium parvum]|uniref:Apple domain-containing protein n=1 Tax=Prymnesium parvum TaxID=97485 RepID=A0AB34J239_PRYPA
MSIPGYVTTSTGGVQLGAGTDARSVVFSSGTLAGTAISGPTTQLITRYTNSFTASSSEERWIFCAQDDVYKKMVVVSVFPSGGFLYAYASSAASSSAAVSSSSSFASSSSFSSTSSSFSSTSASFSSTSSPSSPTYTSSSSSTSSPSSSTYTTSSFSSSSSASTFTSSSSLSFTSASPPSPSPSLPPIRTSFYSWHLNRHHLRLHHHEHRGTFDSQHIVGTPSADLIARYTNSFVATSGEERWLFCVHDDNFKKMVVVSVFPSGGFLYAYASFARYLSGTSSCEDFQTVAGATHFVVSCYCGGYGVRDVAYTVFPAPPSSPPLPPYSPPPLSPPQPVASVTGDPHFRGAHGDAFDLRGDGSILNLLSSPNISLSALFETTLYRASYSNRWVNGSFLRAAYWTLRTATGRRLMVEFGATRYSKLVTVTEEEGRPPTLVWAGHRVQLDDVMISLADRTARVVTPRWRTSARSTFNYPHPYVLRLEVAVQPQYDAAKADCPPHGLLGQTYDADRAPLHGRRDGLQRPDASRVYHTAAQGEGAIEGVYSDYRVASRFATDFRFSRFDGPPGARVRNVSALATLGQKVPEKLRPLLRADGLLHGINFKGADFAARRLLTPGSCRRACHLDARCAAFTFISSPAKRRGPRCWLKHDGFAKGAERSDATVSGVVRAPDKLDIAVVHI